jgi:hypothetical protein
MIHGVQNISITSIGYTVPQGGKMSLPVNPSSLIYSYFKHVSGVAAPEGTNGIAISKLNLLDVLIGQINKIGRSDHFKAAGAKNIDGLIENYGAQLRQAKSTGEAMPYLQSPSTQSGAVFSLTV